MSQDPIGLRGGLKLYEYVTDPNDSIDPLGLVTYHRKNGQFGKKRGRPSKNKRKDRDSEYPSGYRAGIVDQVIAKHTVANGIIRDRDNRVIDRKDITIEHNPSVVDHWNNGGNNMSRKERADDYNDTSKLSILSKSQNSKEGSIKGKTTRYKQQTGPNYSN